MNDDPAKAKRQAMMVARSLPTDTISRMQRAKKMNFEDERFYHATGADFDKFLTTHPWAKASGETAAFFTNSPAVAGSYLPGQYVSSKADNPVDNPEGHGLVPMGGVSTGVSRHYAPGANVMPVRIRDMHKFDVWDMGGGRHNPNWMASTLAAARKSRVPGVIFENMRDPGMMSAPENPEGNPGAPSKVVAVFKPNLIRSEFADFDPVYKADPDITKARGGMIDDSDKAIRRATMVAKGLAKEIGPLPTGDHPKPPHPASMIPGVHVTGMGDGPQTFADGGDVTSNPNFSQWFGNSVAHDNGVPRTYYTGTSKDKDFTSFNVGRHGAWFTTDPHEASQYAESNDSQGHVWENGRFQPTNTAGRVIPAYLKAENPYTGERPEAINRAQNYKKAQSDWFDTLRAAGHDSWIPSSLKGNLAVMLRHPTQIKSAIGNSGAFDPKQKAIHKADGGDVEPTDETGFDVWHGTPHDFSAERLIQHPSGEQEHIAGTPEQLPDVPSGATVLKDYPWGRFQSQAIGSGEGNQAYGHGLYTAQRQDVAKWYKDMLRGVNEISLANESHKRNLPLSEGARAEMWRQSISDSNPSEAARNLQKINAEASQQPHAALANLINDYRNSNRGHLLHVRVNANPDHFLDWDKTLAEQHPHVQAALAADDESEGPIWREQFELKHHGHLTGKEIHGIIRDENTHQVRRMSAKGKPFIDFDAETARQLHEAGIPGVKYLDERSRSGTSNPMRNYVIFDPSIMDIKRKYARGGVVKKFSVGGDTGAGMNNDPMVQKALDVAQQAAPKAIPTAVNAAQSVMQKPTEDHPAWIPQRLITSKTAQPPSAEDRNIVDLDALKSTPKLYQAHTDLLRNYPNMPEHIAKHGSADDVAEAFINHVQDNLLSLHDAVPAQTRNRSKLWYDGANRIAQEWAKKYNIPIHSAAGALAALSPQKDWYQNVSLAHRVVDMLKGNDNFYRGRPADDQMKEKFNSMPSLQKPEYQNLYSLIHGKTLSDIDKEQWEPEAKNTAKALWIRLHDETYNPRSYHIVTPEGGYADLARNADGSESKVGWGSLPEIAKAIGAIQSGDDPAALSELMGEKHKVRNFYNNILSPNSKHGDVTIDTHAVAAGLYRPLSGKSVEVAHNFGNYAGKGIPNAGGSAISGVQGTYPLYAEAYRRAAAKRGILPREMQSITWEAVRGLFPEVFKKGKNVARIDNIWDNYKNGSLTQQQAREQVNAIAAPQGIRPPTWEEGRPTGTDENSGSAIDQGGLSEPVLPGKGSARINPRAGRRVAAAIPQGASGGPSAPVKPKFAYGGDVISRALQLTQQHAPVPAAVTLARNLMPGRR